MSTRSVVADQSVLGLRERWADSIAGFLDPGETLQVVVPARTGVPRSSSSLLENALVVAAVDDGDRYLVIATDRALIPARRCKDGSLRPRERGARDVRLSVSHYHRIGALTRMYSIDPQWADHVRAVNEALDATRRGEIWDPGRCGAWVSREPAGALLGA